MSCNVGGGGREDFENKIDKAAKLESSPQITRAETERERDKAPNLVWIRNMNCNFRQLPIFQPQKSNQPEVTLFPFLWRDNDGKETNCPWLKWVLCQLCCWRHPVMWYHPYCHYSSWFDEMPSSNQSYHVQVHFRWIQNCWKGWRPWWSFPGGYRLHYPWLISFEQFLFQGFLSLKVDPFRVSLPLPLVTLLKVFSKFGGYLVRNNCFCSISPPSSADFQGSNRHYVHPLSNRPVWALWTFQAKVQRRSWWEDRLQVPHFCLPRCFVGRGLFFSRQGLLDCLARLPNSLLMLLLLLSRLPRYA